MRQGGQLYQSSYLPLQTPYTIFGLGRTSNYIEDFAYGITSNEVGVVLGGLIFLNNQHQQQEVHYNHWICIIPNSQLVAIPFKPKNPSEYALLAPFLHLSVFSLLAFFLPPPPSWQLELYISPSDLTLWVILGIFTSLFVLGITVALLQWREKQQDEKEKQENAHIFSFSAL